MNEEQKLIIISKDNYCEHQQTSWADADIHKINAPKIQQSD